jgi:psp operon transcriptional activator
MVPQENDGLSLLGSSPAWGAVMEEVSRVAPLDRPVLVIGERGTGKELVSARLHYLSRRWDRPFVKLNCAALAETLLETELFGHEAGAFTGATRRHFGRFEMANEGTLFLDEIATASMRVQEKVLRVIEYGEFERVGGRETIRTSVRLVAATNVDLPSEAAAGRFRDDLLDRLAFDVITLPPLRARPEDILLLAEHYAQRMSLDLERPLFAGFSARARQRLLDHPWPGNVRELRNVVERAVYRLEDPEEEVEELIFDPFASPWRPRATVAGSPDEPSHRDLTVAVAPEPARESAPPELPMDFCARIAEIEIEWLKLALERARWNQRKAADLLGMSYHQLRGYLRKYKLVGGEESGGE